jgi:predicted acyltransferase (DUF342 family)
LGSTLSVKGASDMVGAVKMGSTLSVKNTFDVEGLARLGSTLSVKGASDMVGAVNMGSTLSVKDTFDVEGLARLGSTLSVKGASDMVGAVKMGSTLSVKDTFNVEGLARLGSTLSVNGASVMVGAVKMGSTLSVKDTFDVGGLARLGNNLSVKANVYVGGILSVNDTVYLNSTLEAKETATFNDKIKVNELEPESGSNMYVRLGTDSNGTLTVYGDLHVVGEYNQIGVESSALQVEDKSITLAVSSNNTPTTKYLEVDGINTNDKSGIIIAGIPDGYTSNHYTYTSNVWDKSFLWNYGEGAQDPSKGIQYSGPQSTFNTSDINNQQSINNEAYWELKGGSLRLTGYIDNEGTVEKISYGIRITKNKELQFVKMEENKAAVQVATFGVRF